ncbi:MAG: hypothetical protein RIT03_33 [Bacteroidota bacterium]
MNNIPTQIQITVNPKLYVKNPSSSELGCNIVRESIYLINEIGFDAFTFKKLGEKIGSNESSLYRYFENKHKLLLYLSSWYWGWMEYRLLLETNNMENPALKLNKAIEIIAGSVKDDFSTDHINEAVLSKIIILEFSKTFLTKEVDQENREGFFLIYKNVVNLLVKMIEAVNPNYEYAKSLASSIIEGSLHQHFLSEHFTSITNCNVQQQPAQFYIHLVSKILI